MGGTWALLAIVFIIIIEDIFAPFCRVAWVIRSAQPLAAFGEPAITHFGPGRIVLCGAVMAHRWPIMRENR
jgi:hypothetical protein